MATCNSRFILFTEYWFLQSVGQCPRSQGLQCVNSRTSFPNQIITKFVKNCYKLQSKARFGDWVKKWRNWDRANIQMESQILHDCLISKGLFPIRKQNKNHTVYDIGKKMHIWNLIFGVWRNAFMILASFSYFSF